MTYNTLIFGKDSTSNIVSCEIKDAFIELFIEKDGKVESKFIKNNFWLLSNKCPDKDWLNLKGNLYYKYGKKFKSKEEFQKTKYSLNRRYDTYCVYDDKEAAMVLNGFTYFKDTKINDVSILSFDIESTGLVYNDTSKVLLISNTYRNANTVERKLFSYDDYETEAELFDDWCSWVREKNPSILCGHNIFGYDLPYLDFNARKAGTTLKLGRDLSDIIFSKKESDFRIDGSKDLQYKKAFIYGREIIDTMFLSYKYDIGRKYESYGLKNIIKQEGLEIKDRQFYDASQIRFTYKDKEEWKKIKLYAIHDADDALNLFDLMIPSYFYLTRSIPKSFQTMLISASGSQINSFLVRSYLQDGHSIPKTTEGMPFEGAISIGNPGIYHNAYKVDVASLYPSIMLEYKIYDKNKDPNAYFQQMVEYFTKERLQNKKLAKETGEKYYKDLQESEKIVINSCYGMLGATGLNFNSPANASLVTRKGREILQLALDWAKEDGFTLVNADTDSITVTYKNEFLTEQDRLQILEILNEISPKQIHWEDDGYYDSVLVLKVKNYVLKEHKSEKLKIKGSALKASMKEPALKKFIEELLNKLIEGKREDIESIYHKYVQEIYNIKDITRWCAKRNITEAVLNPERTNEQKVADAIINTEYVQGDKIYVYFTNEDKLKLKEHWTNDHNIVTLLSKLYDSLCIFETVLDLSLYKNYSLVKNQNLARQLVGLEPIIKEKRKRKEKL
jgi:DNA polymerase elongation subunit (family B)